MLARNFVQILIFGWKNSILELSIQIDALLCYPWKGLILMFSLKTLKFFILIIFSDRKYDLRYSSFKIYIRQSCCLCFKWFLVFSWKVIVLLYMKTLWKLLIIRTILDEGWICVMSFWRVEIFIFSINVVYYKCCCKAFINI